MDQNVKFLITAVLIAIALLWTTGFFNDTSGTAAEGMYAHNGMGSGPNWIPDGMGTGHEDHGRLAQLSGMTNSKAYSKYEAAGDHKARVARGKHTNLGALAQKRGEYAERARNITPDKFLPANMRRDQSQYEENKKSFGWVEGFAPANESQLKDASWMKHSSLDFQAVRDPVGKLNYDLRRAPSVKIYPQLSMWMNMPSQTNQDIDRYQRPLEGPGRLSAGMRALRQRNLDIETQARQHAKAQALAEGNAGGAKRNYAITDPKLDNFGQFASRTGTSRVGNNYSPNFDWREYN